jgi:hypothetical protein
MDSDDKLWLGFWISIAAVILGITAAIVYYNLSADKIWADGINAAVAKGADPIAARCAIQGTAADIATAIMCANASQRR